MSLRAITCIMSIKFINIYFIKKLCMALSSADPATLLSSVTGQKVLLVKLVLTICQLTLSNDSCTKN